MLGRMISMSVRDTTVLNFAKHQIFRIPGMPKDISILLNKETGSIALEEYTLDGSGFCTKINSKSKDGCKTKSRDNSSFREVE